MNSGRHPAGPKSSGIALGKGLILLVVALVIGIVVLRSVPTPVAPRAATTPVTTTPDTAPAQPATKPAATGPSAPTITLPPAKVAVLVANGTTVPAGAGNMVTALKALGYNVLPASDTTAPASATVVYYVSDTYKQAALTLADKLGQPPGVVTVLSKSAPLSTTTGADVVVIEGPTLALRFAGPVSLGTTTTTSTTTTSTTATTAPGG